MSLEKYGLDKIAQDFDDSTRQLFNQALRNAEQKITPSTVGAHWKEIIIFCLLVGVWWFNQQATSAKKELAVKNETYNSLKKIEGIDQTLKAVQDRQTELYPQLDTTLSQIEMAREQLKVMERKIGSLTQGQAQATAKNLTVEALSKDFQALGYPNTVLKEVQR